MQQLVSDSIADDETRHLPIAVDLDGTLIKVDTLYEQFAKVLFEQPLKLLSAAMALRHGIPAFKQELSRLVSLNIESLPVRADLLAYLNEKASAGREIHLATAANQAVAEGVAHRFPIFQSVQSSDATFNLKGANKAERLSTLFPDGFVYAGDHSADLPVWRRAKAAIVVSSDPSLRKEVESQGTPIERIFSDRDSSHKAWLKTLRPHQWAKNLLVLVPVVLGWRDLTLAALFPTAAMLVLLCLVASLTYVINDIADLESDRAHWSKQRRGFASGRLAVRDGLVLAGAAIPILCALALWISLPAGAFLILYVIVTVGYSLSWKRIPLFDTFIIALLFTIRIAIGIAAAQLTPSTWLLTFSMFFFFSMALAKRHTEILRASEHGRQKIEGRGYRAEDATLTMTFGSASAMAAVVIVVLYLVEEVFARQIYTRPELLWITPVAIFLFTCRIWALSHRGRMTDDPVAFALRDRVTLLLGAAVLIGIVLAW